MHLRSCLLLAAFPFLFVVLRPLAVSAEPIAITSGAVHFELAPFIDFRFTGRGFDIAGQSFEDQGLGVRTRETSPFGKGRPADLSADVFLRGAARVGTSPDEVLTEGTLHFRAKPTPLENCSTIAADTSCFAGPTPFTMTGVLNVFDASDRFAFSAHLAGGGTATGSLTNFTDIRTRGGGTPASLDFTFQPTPEPASWFLMAIGGAALALRRRRGAGSHTD